MDRSCDLEDLVPVKYHPYRTARVWDRIIAVPCQYGTWVYIQLKELVQKLGRTMDNHIVIECVTEKGTTVGLWYSDNKLYIGLTIVQERW